MASNDAFVELKGRLACACGPCCAPADVVQKVLRHCLVSRHEVCRHALFEYRGCDDVSFNLLMSATARLHACTCWEYALLNAEEVYTKKVRGGLRYTAWRGSAE